MQLKNSISFLDFENLAKLEILEKYPECEIKNELGNGEILGVY